MKANFIYQISLDNPINGNLKMCISQVLFVTSADKSTASVRKRMKKGRVGECFEMCESRGSPPPLLSLPPSLSFSTWRALPLELTSSNGPVSSPLQPALSLSSGPLHWTHQQLWEELERSFFKIYKEWLEQSLLLVSWTDPRAGDTTGHHRLFLCLLSS